MPPNASSDHTRVFAITHQGFAENGGGAISIESMIEQQLFVFGWRIKDMPRSEWDELAQLEFSFLQHLEMVGGISAVTYGKKRQRWLCLFKPDKTRTIKKPSREEWSLPYAARIPFPPKLVGKGIQCQRKRAIVELFDPQRSQVLNAVPTSWL